MNQNKCCKSINNSKLHISKLTDSQKTEVLKSFNSIKTYAQQNEYLKALVIPTNFIEKTGTKCPRSSNYDYFVLISDKNNPLIKKRVQICKNGFLILHNIKSSRLRKKILRNREVTEDLRGKHDSHINKIPLEVVLDIREFIENYPSRESHYCSSVKTGRKYIDSDKNVAILHREFIDIYQEHENYVKYQFFNHVFKQCNVGFGLPRADICCSCEELDIKIKAAKSDNQLLEIETLEKCLKNHQDEANFFYILQDDIKTSTKNDPKIAVISIDYEKNFFVPVTKVSIEYYSRQLSIHNCGIHDMKTGFATMFMYSENFAGKGPNETISFLNHYFS